MTTPERSAYIDAQIVAKYLSDNPEFFNGREDLLTEIRVPHSHGHSVSLVEKQLDILRERNSELRNRLGELIDNARSNDRLFSHTRRLVLALLDCQNLSQAVDTIYASFANDFNIQFTQIILFGETGISKARNVDLDRAQFELGKYLKARQTVGGGLAKDEINFLFGGNAPKVGSAALAVLSYGDLFGVIAIGNEDPHYYQSSMGTMFLSYIAEVFSRILRDQR